MGIFIPALTLGIYTMLFFFYTGLNRRRAVLNREMNPKYYRTYSEGEEPERLRILTRHMANLLETPTLFYAGVVMIYVTGFSSTVFIALAWAYVGLRFVHAYIHLGTNFVLHRFLVFGTSMLVLVAMWIWLLIRVVTHVT